MESLSQAIRTCTEAHANSILPVGNPGKYTYGMMSTYLEMRIQSLLSKYCYSMLYDLYDVTICHSIYTIAASSRPSGQSYTKLSLTVLQANNLALSTSNCKTRNHYCSVQLASCKCRTPSIEAKCWPSWNFKV